MFYYIDVHSLAHYIQWIKMHGETVKNNEILYTQFRFILFLIVGKYHHINTRVKGN
jgi:hypothetical protein